MPSRDVAWWQNLRLEVGKVVDEIDPEGLLAMGAPPGEYAHEIERLTSLVIRDEVSEQSVLAVWERAFGAVSHLSRRPDQLTLLAQELLKARERRSRP